MMKNKVSNMTKPDEIKALLQTHGNTWKNLMHQNATVMTQIYESQSQAPGMQALHTRF
jgi:hypothetical protein